jgi:hypothetical protein
MDSCAMVPILITTKHQLNSHTCNPGSKSTLQNTSKTSAGLLSFFLKILTIDRAICVTQAQTAAYQMLQNHSKYKFKLQVQDGQLPHHTRTTQAFGHHRSDQPEPT